MSTGPAGSVFRESGEMGPGDVYRVPLPAVRHGGAWHTSKTGRCGDCRRVMWAAGPRGQYSKKILFSEKRGIQDNGGRHVAKHSSDSRQAYLQRRDLVRVVSIIAAFAPMGAGTRGKFVLSSPRGEMGPGDVCRVSGSGTPRESQANQSRDRVGIVDGSVGTGPARSVFGENPFYRET